jgi:hypothetical protein
VECKPFRRAGGMGHRIVSNRHDAKDAKIGIPKIEGLSLKFAL